MKTVYTFFILISTCFLTLNIDLKKAKSINSPNWILSSQIISDTKHKINYLYLSCKINNKSQLIIYNNECKSVFQQNNINGELYSESIFLKNNKLFFFNKQLCALNLEDFGIEKFNIKDNNYESIKIVKPEKTNLLIASNDVEITIFDLETVKELMRIKREARVRYDEIKIYEDLIIYQTSENCLSCFSIFEKRIIWEYKAGEHNVYLLGVKVGSANDLFTEFKICKEDKVYLISATAGGNIVKLDLLTGNPILKKDRFKGNGNNAGLMNHFELFDMNKDGVKDIIGGSVDNNVYCINGKDFSLIWEYNTGNESQLPISLFDIDGDKIPEVFGVTDYDNNLFILDGKTGKLLFEKTIKNNELFNQSNVLLGDFLGKGCLNLIVKSNPNQLQIYYVNNIKVPTNSIQYQPSNN